MRRFGLLIVSAGVFLDGGEIANPVDVRASNGWLFDAGGGLRLGVGDGTRNVFRLDSGEEHHRRPDGVVIGLHQSEWPPFD